MTLPFPEDWSPTMRASLCFVLRGKSILLIRKKRGLGAGKINGPGGRLEPGETALQAAIRETEEEVGVTPINPTRAGELHFQFEDGLALHCTVFLSSGCIGEAVETDEAIPLWTDIASIPYDEMWEDDRQWLPGMLAGRIFRGYYRFDGERMLSHHLLWD